MAEKENAMTPSKSIPSQQRAERAMTRHNVLWRCVSQSRDKMNRRVTYFSSLSILPGSHTALAL